MNEPEKLAAERAIRTNPCIAGNCCDLLRLYLTNANDDAFEEAQARAPMAFS